jgi:hypothetical protein
MMPRNAEERELCRVATHAILATVRAARRAGRYAPWAWLREPVVHHQRRALLHVANSATAGHEARRRRETEPHEEHGLTRMCMALAVQERARLSGRKAWRTRKAGA